MKIRFVTLDMLVCIKECPDIELPVSVVMSPCWNKTPTSTATPERFQQWRRYEFRGEVQDNIPTVHEQDAIASITNQNLVVVEKGELENLSCGCSAYRLSGCKSEPLCPSCLLREKYLKGKL